MFLQNLRVSTKIINQKSPWVGVNAHGLYSLNEWYHVKRKQQCVAVFPWFSSFHLRILSYILRLNILCIILFFLYSAAKIRKISENEQDKWRKSDSPEIFYREISDSPEIFYCEISDSPEIWCALGGVFNKKSPWIYNFPRTFLLYCYWNFCLDVLDNSYKSSNHFCIRYIKIYFYISISLITSFCIIISYCLIDFAKIRLFC